MSETALAGTFVLNKIEPIHRWYAYIEGYSSKLVEDELDLLSGRSIATIYDPFAGTGTTLLSASMRGIVPYYSETNPFMNSVTATKINAVRSVSEDEIKLQTLVSFLEKMRFVDFTRCKEIDSWDGFEKYFSVKNLSELLYLKRLIEDTDDETVRSILMLALSSIIVSGSKMVRRGDLRFAKGNEKKEIDIKSTFIEKLSDIVDDVTNYGKSVLQPVFPLAADCRDLTEEDLIDCVITSPPYLNGTNYIRNTKLELKLNGHVKSEKDLSAFHSKGIVAGINNVSKRTISNHDVDEVASVVSELKECAYDKRIPIMVNDYFYDMNNVFIKLRQLMRNKGVFIMDIGDSQFAGVHVPTHDILTALCEKNGFVLETEQVIRSRYSKNGMLLSQRLLRFRLEK